MLVRLTEKTDGFISYKSEIKGSGFGRLSEWKLVTRMRLVDWLPCTDVFIGMNLFITGKEPMLTDCIGKACILR
jgi:hypothetical protein